MRKMSGFGRNAVLAVIVTGVSVGAAAAPALATDRLAQAAPGQEQVQPSQYSDQELQAFAKSVVEVQQTNQKLASEMQATTDAAERDAMQQQSYSDMEAIIASNGLSIDEYNEIASVAQTDDTVRQKVTQYINQFQSGGAM